jgi:ABC-type glycerol-3-phosphate transport system substrate-binding protein
MKTLTVALRSFLFFVVLLAFAAMPSQSLALEGKVVVVTSFPKDLTNAFKNAFQKKNPGVKVEILNKKTTAGIKYVQETAKNNTSDIFWASAPDAFEVLKGDGLLQKYKPKAKGIPAKVGAYPINDPDGYYTGFAPQPCGDVRTVAFGNHSPDGGDPSSR